MFAQSTSELSSIPIRLWVAEYEGVKRYWIQGGKPYRQELVCKMEFYSLIRGSSVSPNRRFIVVALHAETADMTVFSVSPPRLIRRFVANGEVKAEFVNTGYLFHSSGRFW